MGFGQARLIHDGMIEEGAQLSFQADTDGFLMVTVNGHDDSWTYATVTLSQSSPLHPHPIPWPILTWSYSAQQNFRKAVMANVAVRKCTSCVLDWSDRRKASKLGINVLWQPLSDA